MITVKELLVVILVVQLLSIYAVWKLIAALAPIVENSKKYLEVLLKRTRTDIDRVGICEDCGGCLQREKD